MSSEIKELITSASQTLPIKGDNANLTINENTIIIDDPTQRITPDILNRFEVTAVLSKRAREIELGSPYDQSLESEILGQNHAIEIAEKELEYGLIPYNIYRKIGTNTYEKWSVSEMYFHED
jgi:DNA-directed RNA polymerase subunit K/omega